MSRLSPITRPALVALALTLASPLLAQNAGDSAAEARLRKLEAEVAALQRQVFPGGDARFFPQIQPAQQGQAAPGTPASAPSADMLARVDALEAQLARLTAQVEETGNKVGKIDARVTTLEAASASAATAAASPPAAAPVTSTDTNLAAMTGGATAPKPAASAPPAPAPAAVTPASKPATSAALAPKPAATTAKPGAKTPPAPKPVPPSPQRLAAVKKIEKPVSKDPGDDEYSYGYRLWEAKFYPEAVQQLKLYLQKYPKHPRVSFARNLLGRAYLDDGNLDEAKNWFYENYRADKAGARASDSLLYLAETVKRQKDNNRACIALAQFVDDYPTEASGRLRSQYEATRAGLKCD